MNEAIRMESDTIYYYGLKTAARALHLSRTTLERRIKTHGMPPCTRLGSGYPLMIAAEDLRAWHAALPPARPVGRPKTAEANA
jgi:hypothetical protein